MRLLTIEEIVRAGRPGRWQFRDPRTKADARAVLVSKDGRKFFCAHNDGKDSHAWDLTPGTPGFYDGTNWRYEPLRPGFASRNDDRRLLLCGHKKTS